MLRWGLAALFALILAGSAFWPSTSRTINEASILNLHRSQITSVTALEVALEDQAALREGRQVLTQDRDYAVRDGERVPLPQAVNVHGHIRPLGSLSPVGSGVPDTPLMNWESPQLRRRIPVTYCFSQLPTQVVPVARAVLNEVYALFEPADLPPWKEASCQTADVIFHSKAQQDCGSGAAGCAAFWSDGQRAGAYISYEASWGPSLKGIRVILSHEVGHWFNLDHTDCNHGHLSVMSPVYLPDGPACAGAAGVVLEDFQEAATYYGFRLRGGSSPGPGPIPPPLTPEPKKRQVSGQRWTWVQDEGCPDPNQEGWCIRTTPFTEPATAGSWYTVVVIHPDGSLSYPLGFTNQKP